MEEQKKNSSNPLRAIGAVFAAFTGIRRGRDSRNDVANLRPVQIIVAALICAAVFIGGLLILVKSITSGQH